ncbi:hypothetical protein [Mycobacterium sp.]|uniref:hypothetical protein n=1 Tax=Mycobacterium sp. TaxID=1785 RepID=UPI003BACEC98
MRQPKLKNQGTVPTHGDCAALPYPRVSADDAASAVVGYTPKEARELNIARQTKKVARWRTENPFACTRWLTAHGAVTGVFGWKFYRGECVACGGLITACRKYPSTRDLQTGKWPQMCSNECSNRKRDEHNGRVSSLV